MPSLYVLANLLAFFPVLWLLRRLLSKGESERHLPPGPRGLPVIGSLLELPRSQEWETYSQWSDKWGDIMSVTALGQRIVILGSLEATFDLLDKRGSIYSDRPYLTLTGEIVGHQNTIPLCPYGDRMKKLRRMFTKAVGTRQLVESFAPMIMQNMQDLILRLIQSPDRFKEHILLMTSANVLLLSHGHRATSSEDRFIKLSNAVMNEFSLLATPGRYFVDYLPALRHIPSWVPGTGWKEDAKKYRKNVMDAVAEPYEFVKREMAAGTAIPSFCSRNLEDGDTSSDHEDCVQYGAMAMYTAGSDTTAASVTVFILAMTLYPDVQSRAQAELDAVVGTDRLPDFHDRNKLPYITALCSEAIRWMPATPLALSHKTTEDDTYRGYFIPKGTIVLPNSWRLLHDPDTYHDPMVFKPERFLSSEGKEPELNPNKIAFGYGRRMCPGILVTEATMFITIATMLSTFSISPVVENGKYVMPSVKQTDGLISHPAPFKCSIKPRSVKAEMLVKSTIESR